MFSMQLNIWREKTEDIIWKLMLPPGYSKMESWTIVCIWHPTPCTLYRLSKLPAFKLHQICFPQLGPSLLPYTLMWVSAVAGFMEVWTQKGQKLIVLYRAPPQPSRSNYEIAAPAASCALCSSSILAFPPPSKDWSWGSSFIALGFLVDRCSNPVGCGRSVFSLRCMSIMMILMLVSLTTWQLWKAG